jgi:hypothetical protein
MLIWAMAGCIQTMTLDDLTEGMTTDEVQARLGDPNLTETSEDLVAYQYESIWVTGRSDAPVAVVSYRLSDGAIIFDKGQLAAASRGSADDLMIEVQQGKERALFLDIHRWGEHAKYSGHFLNLGQRAVDR